MTRATAAARAIVTEPAGITPGGMVVSTRRRVQAPLERMRARGQISMRQAAAGERLYAAWALGVVGARDRDAPGCSAWSPAGYTDAQLAALQDYRQSCAAMGGLANVAVLVCCYGMTVRSVALGATGSGSGHAVTRVADMLRQALTQLAESQGIPDVE